MNQEQQIPFVEKKKKWRPNYDIHRETPFFRFIPKSYFKLRDIVFAPFHRQIKSLGISVGFLLTIIIVNAVGAFFVIYQYQDKSEQRAIDYGLAAGTFLGFAYMTTSKNSLFIVLTGVSMETQIKIHKLWSYFVLPLLFVHVYREIELQKIPFLDQRMLSGISAGIVFLLIILTGILFQQYNVNFNTFMMTHRILYILLFICAFLHNAPKIFTFGVFWLWFDSFLRIIFMLYNRLLLSLKEKEIVGEHVLLKFKKKKRVTFKEGQFYFLYCPQISKWELHPFSIFSANYENDIAFLIRKFNNWTKDLYDMVEQKQDFQIYLDGPYGNTRFNTDHSDIKIMIFISGGVGMTPLLSLAKKTLRQIHRGRKMEKIYFAYRARNEDLLPYINVLSKAVKQYNIEDKLDLNLSIRNKGHERINILDLIVNGCKLGKEKKVKKIAVFVCGPKEMNQEVEKTVNEKVIYTEGQLLFHSEIFNTLLLQLISKKYFVMNKKNILKYKFLKQIKSYFWIWMTIKLSPTIWIYIRCTIVTENIVYWLITSMKQQVQSIICCWMECERTTSILQSITITISI